MPYLSGPLGLVSIICAASAMPRTPFQPHYSASTDSFHVKVARTLKETDWIGLSLVVMTCVSMILRIEQLTYSWKSPATIVLLVLSVISLCLFIAIERHISNTGHIFGLRIQPFYPWHLRKRRPLAFTFLYSFLKGTLSLPSSSCYPYTSSSSRAQAPAAQPSASSLSTWPCADFQYPCCHGPAVSWSRAAQLDHVLRALLHTNAILYRIRHRCRPGSLYCSSQPLC